MSGAEGLSPRLHIFVRYEIAAFGCSNAFFDGDQLPLLHGKEFLDSFCCQQGLAAAYAQGNGFKTLLDLGIQGDRQCGAVCHGALYAT